MKNSNHSRPGVGLLRLGIGAIAVSLLAASSMAMADRKDGDNRRFRCTISPTSQTIHEGDSINFNGSASGGRTPYDYSWSFPGGNPGVASGSEQTVTYENAGEYTATLTVRDNSRHTRTCTKTAEITVQSVQPQACNIAVSPTTLAFGDVNVGGSATLSTTVSNSGTAACEVTLSGIGGSDFSASPTGFSVATGSSQTVDVTYTPGQTGGDTDTLVVNSNDPDSATVEVALSGNGVQQPPQECNIAVSPTSLAFGDVDVGSSASLGTTVSNSGTAPCNVTLFGIGGSDFSASPTGFSVAAESSRTVNVTYTPGQIGTDTDTLVVNSNDPDSATVNVTLSGKGVQQQTQCIPANLDISINSTSQNGCPDGTVPQVPTVLNSSTKVLAINDLGMHCGDLDTRIASILPPFQVLLAQVIQQGSHPSLNPSNVDVFYSAASNPNDPILGSDVFDGVMANGDTYKTNFWDFPVPAGTYDPFYPAYDPFNPVKTLTPLAGAPFNVTADVGLPVPNVEDFYIGPDGQVNSGDESLTAVTHAMPGIAGPYTANAPKQAKEHFTDKPFFVNFPFGYVAADVNWYEGAGIPFAAFDDNGRENAYPLVRVEARQGGNTLATVDTVLPISGEASCVNCHADPDDLTAVTGRTSRSPEPTDTLSSAGLPVVTSLSDPDGDMPMRVSLEYASDINTLRLHDLKHGAKYVAPAPADDGTTVAAPCNISASGGDGDANCLTNRALVQGQPVVCQVCHYTPALDLAQLGPLTGPEGGIANGRNQLSHSSNSNVMHGHHASTGLFPAIPAPTQLADGTITNQAKRLAALEDSCYQCHPGTKVQCLRGAMFNGGMLCSDCHGSMEQVGADFSQNVSPSNPGDFVLDPNGNFYDPADPQPRVPWANEPGCGSCHTGDANSTIAGANGTVVNTVDSHGNTDGIRLRVAYRTTNNPKAAPIVPTDKRFAEPAVPGSFNGFTNPGAGNPQLYRVSTGHGGVMCEGCHGATHAEWPNADPTSNDNTTARQLQGHTGVIVECSTCHGTAMNSSNTLNGPHGMHPVGDNTSFADGGHEHVNTSGCSDCHGPGGRSNNQGTVLSVAKADRNLRGTLVRAGEPVGCSACHGGGGGGDDD